MEELCRVCTSNCVTLVNIFEDREQIEDEPPLADMLNECASCGISRNDQLPQSICQSCISAAQDAFRFKRRCERSQKYFRQQMQRKEQNPTNNKKVSTDDWPDTQDNIEMDSCEEELITDDWPIDPAIKAERPREDEQEVDWNATDMLDLMEASGSSSEDDLADGSLSSSEEGEWQEDETNTTRRFLNRCSGQRKNYSDINVMTEWTKERPHLCQTCGKGFSSKRTLLSHQRVHNEARPFQCPHCPQTFKGKSSCRVHIRLHTGETPFECHRCSAKFSRNDELKKHLLFHSGERPHQCPYCPKTFIARSVLIKHIRLHTDPRAHKCPFCLKAFNNNYALQGHIRIHTGEKPYKCSHCPKTFKLRGDVVVHTRTHTGERPFKCDKCDRSYARFHNFNQHKKTHSRQGEFKCTKCSLTYARAGDLKRHMHSHSYEQGLLDGNAISADNFEDVNPDLDEIDSLSTAQSEDLTNEPTQRSRSSSVGSSEHKNTSIEHNLEDIKPDLSIVKAECLDIADDESVYTPKSEDMSHSDSENTCSSIHEMNLHRLNDLIEQSKINSGKYKCPKCSITYMRPGDLKRHLRKHDDREKTTYTRNYKCPKCPATYIRPGDLKRHVQSHDKKQKTTYSRNYKCPLCATAYIRPGDLNRHMQKCLENNKSGKKTVDRLEDAQANSMILDIEETENFIIVKSEHLENEETDMLSMGDSQHEFPKVSVKEHNANSSSSSIHEASHTRQNHSKKSVLKCPHCIKNYIRPCDLTRHLQSHDETRKEIIEDIDESITIVKSEPLEGRNTSPTH